MLHYKSIEILTDEDARYGRKSVTDAVIDYIRGLKIAARCVVTRGIAGCDESGAVATTRVEVLSSNLPIRIAIILPAATLEQVLQGLDQRVSRGIITVHDLQVARYKTTHTLFPPQLTVRDAMTPAPARITPERPASEAARLLLSSIFTSLPVVDRHDRPVGIISQGDLIHRGGLPVRLGLLAETEQERIEALMHALDQQPVAELMTRLAVTLTEGQSLLDAVDLLLSNQLKRLPVTGKDGQLVGMLSRLDILTIVRREAPDWGAFQAQAISVANRRCVGDITRRDTYTVLPETTVDTVLQLISRNDIQQVAVVNTEGALVGVIADSDLLRFFLPKPAGIRSLFAQLSHSLQPDSSQKLQVPADATAGDIMRTDMPTIRDQASIEEAIGLMIEQRLKRLPVIDDQGRFQGMISRESLLRTAFGQQNKPV